VQRNPEERPRENACEQNAVRGPGTQRLLPDPEARQQAGREAQQKIPGTQQCRGAAKRVANQKSRTQ